ncbi:MAG TPA: DMT family transporter [Candidatus Limnocylindrales bacterium]|nr:DMT family transporter [Candidatus Limnocylindrales bacterium]
MIPPSLSVIVLGLTSSIVWGVSDFLGGLASRRAPLFGVLVGAQLIGLAIAAPVAVLRGEGPLLPVDVVWSVVSGLIGAVGIGCLYRGLAVGRMGVVAPVTGVLVAVIPVLAGMALDGVPSAIVLAGIVLAIASVAIVARVPGAVTGAPTGLWWGIAAGLTLGVFTVTFSRVSHGLVFGPLTLMKSVEGLALYAAIVVGHQPWRVPRSLWPMLIAVGVLDMGATAAYLAATQAGPLAVAGVLSALYPVMTVLLAATILRERITRVHALGIVVAAAAIALIAGGSAG